MFANQTYDTNNLLQNGNGNLLGAKVGVHTNTATSSITSPPPAVLERLQQQQNVLMSNGFTHNLGNLPQMLPNQLHWQMTNSNGAKLVGNEQIAAVDSHQTEMVHQHAHHPYNTRTRKKR
ncbi:hypothetical protein Ddc_06832 [Ditylenchus destructor]|nr:hypothetical protein Ddc_06832 [Ditylenchus destructor]